MWYVKLLCLFTLFVALSSCDSQIRTWVNDVNPGTEEPAPVVNDNTVMKIKMSPGRLSGVAAGMSIQGTLTTNNQRFQMGSDASIALSMNRTRVSAQF